MAHNGDFVAFERYLQAFLVHTRHFSRQNVAVLCLTNINFGGNVFLLALKVASLMVLNIRFHVTESFLLYKWFFAG